MISFETSVSMWKLVFGFEEKEYLLLDLDLDIVPLPTSLACPCRRPVAGSQLTTHPQPPPVLLQRHPSRLWEKHASSLPRGHGSPASPYHLGSTRTLHSRRPARASTHGRRHTGAGSNTLVLMGLSDWGPYHTHASRDGP